MPRSPKLLIFLTVFIDLLGFGIVIPILGPTSIEFINWRKLNSVAAGIRSDYPAATIDFADDRRSIHVAAPDAVQVREIEGEFVARLTACNFEAEEIVRLSNDATAAPTDTAAGGLALHVHSETGHAGIGTALLMVSFSLLQLLFTPLWGRLSDRHGRRPILLISLCGSTFSYVLFAFSRSFELLLLSRVLAGISAANITAAQAYIADITSKEERTAGMGLIGMAFGLGFSLGPVIGWLGQWLWKLLDPDVSPMHYHVGPALLAAAICGINLVWAYFGLPESLPRERRGKVSFKRFATTREAIAMLRHPVLGPLIILIFLVTFAFANVEVSFSLFAKSELGMDLPYGLFIYIGLVMAFTQGFLVRRLVTRIPEQTLMIYGAVLLVIGLVMLPVWKAMPLLLLSLAILSIGQGLCQPVVFALLSRRTAADMQGNVFGTSQSVAALARIVGPAFGGLCYEFGHRFPFWAGAVIMLGAVRWAVLTRRRLLAHAEPLSPAEPVETVLGELATDEHG